ncbi:uncharacterized protein LOC105192789 [Solenopsis invicta]|uniref:uncharacterized protein LOC105192789 n=1 Tax=Solenopsis invicta TaxID=13686 RepID=UPI00193C90B6|nr:uncharacterized protein LOC105192789 [Solenopsis invicta]
MYKVDLLSSPIKLKIKELPVHRVARFTSGVSFERKRRPDNQNVLRGEEGDGLGQASSPGAAMFWYHRSFVTKQQLKSSEWWKRRPERHPAQAEQPWVIIAALWQNYSARCASDRYFSA